MMEKLSDKEVVFECYCGEVFTDSRIDLLLHLKRDHDGDKLRLTSTVFEVEEFTDNETVMYRSIRRKGIG